MAYDWSGNHLAQQHSDRIVLAAAAAVIVAVTALPFALRSVGQDEGERQREPSIINTAHWKLRL